MGAGGFIARRIGLFLLAIAVFSGFVSSVQANTLYVGDGGYQTIQDAIDAAGPGDTVVVGPGTYLENVTLWDSKEGIRLVAEVPHEVELVGSLKVEADGASIDGFHVRWTSESEWVGVEIVSGADVSITNSKIEGFSDEEIYALIINASGGGTWQYEGTVDLVSEGDVNGLYARVGDGSEILVGGAIVVTSEDDWAEGFRAEAGEDLLVTLKDVKVTADWGGRGYLLDRAERLGTGF